MKSGLYMTTGDDQFSVVGMRRSSKALPNAELAPKNGHGHCLVVFCPFDPRQLSESQWNHYIYEVCSANWWDAPKTAIPVATVGQQKGPSSSPWQHLTSQPTKCWHNQCFKHWTHWMTNFCFICHIHLLTNQLPLLQASQKNFFAENMLPQQTGGRKCFPGVGRIPKHRFLCYWNKQTYFSLSKMCCEEGWALKNWCFWTVVLEKTLESPLDWKEIQPVHPKGNQSWLFIGRTDVEAETPILWPPHEKSWLTGKHPDAGRDWGQEEKGMTEDEMVGWHHQLNGHGFE